MHVRRTVRNHDRRRLARTLASSLFNFARKLQNGSLMMGNANSQNPACTFNASLTYPKFRRNVLTLWPSRRPIHTVGTCSR